MSVALAGRRPPARLRAPETVPALAWAALAVAVIAGAIVFVELTGIRPAYDAYGWLVWGREALHGRLNTNGTPSWKPLTFLFTLPYALAGRGALWLWMVTAMAAAFAAPIPAARIVHRLAGGRRGGAGPVIAAVLAAIGVWGLFGYWHNAMIFTSDALVVALCLAAIDSQLSGHPRAAFGFVLLAGLGRPEVWPFVALHAIWAWRARPGMRPLIVAGGVATVALWFGIPALTSRSWLSAGETALRHASSGRRVVENFLSLNATPIHIAALGALTLAAVRRRWRWLALAGGAVLWVAIWVGLAAHSWLPQRRYLYEPAAVEIVLAAAALGSLMGARRWAVRAVGLALSVALVVSLIGTGRDRWGAIGNGIASGRVWALQIHRLGTAVAREGGGARVLACGEPVTNISYQTILAWTVGVNNAGVDYHPPRVIPKTRPIVFFKPFVAGWRIRPLHTPPAERRSCARLRDNTPFHSRPLRRRRPTVARVQSMSRNGASSSSRTSARKRAASAP